MISQLPDAPDVTEPEPFAGPDHPMRKVTRQVAFEGGWSPGRAAKVGALFDSMAAEWAGREIDATRAAPVLDALERGGLSLAGRWIELGCGAGAGCQILDGRVERLVAVDLSAEMLANAPATTPRVRTDASTLPFPDGSADVVLAINMLLFPDEVDRVLAPGGALLWVNTSGDQTPIHLSAADVVAALPGPWSALTARAGAGLWAVVRRGEEPGVQVSPRWARWRDEIDLEEYDTRWERRAEAGHEVHGEADLVMSFQPRSVLDAGCGMGRVGIELARRGCEVVGVDLDDDLLAYARRRGPDLTWHCADLATLDLMADRGRGFDVVVLAGNVVNFCRPEVRADIVGRLAAHLEPGGRLIAGFGVEPEAEAGTNADHYGEACAAAGLVVEHRWSSWDRDPFGSSSHYALFVDRRPSGPSSARPPRAAESPISLPLPNDN